MPDSNAQIKKSLATDHLELDGLLDELFAAFDASSIEQVYQTLDIFWARMAMHIRAENLHLFPAILGASESEKHQKENRVPKFKVVRGVVASLHEDHDFFMRELAGAIKQLRDLRGKNHTDPVNRLLSVRETIIAVERRLETHNAREETDVYRWAELLLDGSEQTDLNERMQKEIENLPLRFRRVE